MGIQYSGSELVHRELKNSKYVPGIFIEIDTSPGGSRKNLASATVAIGLDEIWRMNSKWALESVCIHHRSIGSGVIFSDRRKMECIIRTSTG